MAAHRSKSKTPGQHIILPEIISKEPLGPMVRQGDDQWLDIITYTIYALIIAEELGINQTNIDTPKIQKSNNPKIKRFLGIIAGNGKSLGLKNEKWAYNIIKQVGNYADIFERNVGKNTALKLERGLNSLWSSPEKGMLYSPPFN